MSSASGTRRVRQPRSPAGIDGAICAAIACSSRSAACDRHAGREPREDVELVVQAVFLGHVGLHRHRDLDVAGQRQADRRHADDGVGVPVELQRLADDVGPAAEVPAPEPVRNDRDLRAVRPILVRA